MKLAFVAPKVSTDPLDLLTAVLGGKTGDGIKILSIGKNGVKMQQTAAEPREPFASILRSAFDILCQELGLADDPRTVDMSFVDNLGDSDGTTSNVDTDPFVVTLQTGAPWQVLSTLAHEMIHVRDLAKGILRVEDDEVYYNGKKVNDSFVNRTKQLQQDDLGIPQEREAYDKMWPLSLYVLHNLSPDHQAYLTKAYTESLKPPTLNDYYTKRRDQRIKKVEEAEKIFQKVKASGQNPQLQAYNSFYDLT